jgi:hypothetical protein
MAKTSAFPWVVRTIAFTHRKQQISKVVKPHSEISSSDIESYFSRPKNTLTALTSDLNTKPEIALRKAASHSE